LDDIGNPIGYSCYEFESSRHYALCLRFNLVVQPLVVQPLVYTSRRNQYWLYTQEVKTIEVEVKKQF